MKDKYIFDFTEPVPFRAIVMNGLPIRSAVYITLGGALVFEYALNLEPMFHYRPDIIGD